LAIADRVLMFDPENKDAKLMKAAVYERQGKLELAGDTYEPIADSPAMGDMLRARAASLDGKSEEAVAILKQAVQKEPDNVQLVGMAVNELVNLGRREEAKVIVDAALKAKPEERLFKQLAVISRADLSEAQRDEALLEIIQSEEDAYKRSLDLVMHYARRADLASALTAVNEALQHVRERDTPLARTATDSHYSALLKTKVRVAGQLDDQAALAEARDEAAKYNVDGAGGKSILGLYHMQRREFDLAIKALREMIAQHPSDALSLASLGQCYHVQGRHEEAQNAYQRAVAANRELGLAHQGLAALAKARGDEATFQSELAICKRLSPEDPWVREQLLIQTEEQDPQSAIARREASDRNNPEDGYNLQRLASLYEKVNDVGKADEVHKRLHDLQPDDPRVAATSAAYFRRTRRPQRAIQLLSEFVSAQREGENRELAFRLLSNEHLEQGDAQAAEKTLLDGVADSPSVDMKRAVADFYARRTEQPAKAIDWYTQALEGAEKSDSPSAPLLLEARILARLHRAVNDFDGARTDVELLQRRFPDFARGSLWEAEIHARRGEIGEAVDSLSAYLSERPDDVYALFQRARHRVAQGALGQAIADLEAIKRINSTALQSEPRVLLARLYRRSGRTDLWVRELESVTAESPNLESAVQELADAYIRLERYDDADRLVTVQINRPGAGAHGRWYFLRGRVSLELGQGDKAIRDYEQGAQADGLAAPSVAQVLALYARLKEDARGIDYFERVRSRVPASPIVGSHFALLLARAGRTTEAVEQFRQAMALALANEPASSRAVADDLQAAFGVEEAVSLLSQPPADEALRRANDRLLVRVHGVGKKYDAATELLDALIASAATDAERAGLLHEKGTVLELAGAYDEAIVAYERALEYDRLNWVTLNNLAYVLSDRKGESERALPYAQRAVALADNSFTLDTLGWIYVGLRRFQPAIAELSRAIRLDPDYGWAYYHLGEAHRKGGQFTEAADVLKTGRDLAVSTDDSELTTLIDAAAAKVASADRG